jgi:DHA1 family bicyclomycin/chloramphenicol resistance-like MFS transporter
MKDIHDAQAVKTGSPYFYFLIILLGFLSAFGPFLTDMYLPTLPAMVKDFDTTESLVQFSLTMGMIGLAVGQIFFGPISQKTGRKPVLIATLVLFIIAAAACVFSKSITFFLVCRLAQGLGGAGSIVLSRSIATDCYRGRELAKMMAIIGAINGIAPATAPVIGGLVAGSGGWHGIFYILTAIGVVLLLLSFFLKETLPADKRSEGSVFAVFKEYVGLSRIGRFVALVLCYGFAAGVLFAYISAAPFIIQNDFGQNEVMFAVIFGVNSVFIGVGSGIALRFKSLNRAMVVGTRIMAAMALVQLITVVIGSNIYTYEITTALMLMALGIAFTTTTSMAMEQGRDYIGAASAIVGAIGFLFGGVVSPMVGMGDTQLTTSIILTVSGAISAVIATFIYKRSKMIEHS